MPRRAADVAPALVAQIPTPDAAHPNAEFHSTPVSVGQALASRIAAAPLLHVQHRTDAEVPARETGPRHLQLDAAGTASAVRGATVESGMARPPTARDQQHEWSGVAAAGRPAVAALFGSADAVHCARVVAMAERELEQRSLLDEGAAPVVALDERAAPADALVLLSGSIVVPPVSPGASTEDAGGAIGDAVLAACITATRVGSGAALGSERGASARSAARGRGNDYPKPRVRPLSAAGPMARAMARRIPSRADRVSQAAVSLLGLIDAARDGTATEPPPEETTSAAAAAAAAAAAVEPPPIVYVVPQNVRVLAAVPRGDGGTIVRLTSARRSREAPRSARQSRSQLAGVVSVQPWSAAPEILAAPHYTLADAPAFTAAAPSPRRAVAAYGGGAAPPEPSPVRVRSLAPVVMEPEDAPRGAGGGGGAGDGAVPGHHADALASTRYARGQACVRMFECRYPSVAPSVVILMSLSRTPCRYAGGGMFVSERRERELASSPRGPASKGWAADARPGRSGLSAPAPRARPHTAPRHGHSASAPQLAMAPARANDGDDDGGGSRASLADTLHESAAVGRLS